MNAPLKDATNIQQQSISCEFYYFNALANCPSFVFHFCYHYYSPDLK